MKYIFLFFLLINGFLKAQTKKENEFILNGSITGLSDCYVYFSSYNYSEKRFLDSIKLINGKFVYKGKLNGYLDRFYIKLNPTIFQNNDSLNNVRIPIDNSVMYLDLELGNFSKYKLRGCVTCILLDTFNMKLKKHEALLEKYQLIIDDSMSEKKTKSIFEKRVSDIQEKFDAKTLNWCLKNPNSGLTPYLLCGIANNTPFKKAKSLFSNISEIQKNSFHGNRLKKIIEEKRFEDNNQKNQIGQNAFMFERVDYYDSIIRLKNLSLGNFVLIDFWASWCKPCRLSHPNLISLYKKYQHFNFKVVSVSVDEDTVKWKGAIKADSIFLWSNILSEDKTKKKSIDIGSKYFISEYPTKILIDNKGKIIGRYIGENLLELDNKLKEILK